MEEFSETDNTLKLIHQLQNRTKNYKKKRIDQSNHHHFTGRKAEKDNTRRSRTKGFLNVNSFGCIALLDLLAEHCDADIRELSTFCATTSPCTKTSVMIFTTSIDPARDLTVIWPSRRCLTDNEVLCIVVANV